jgi:hypothetical protein
VTSEHERVGALEALDRILNRGGDADDVLRDVVRVLSGLYAYAGVDFVEGDSLVEGPSAGDRTDDAARLPISFQGTKVAELVVAKPDDDDDQAFLERVALIISPYCLVGWDTAGEPWEP